MSNRCEPDFPGILVAFHCSANAGYAMNALEPTLRAVATELVGDARRVHVGYSSVDAFATAADFAANRLQVNLGDPTARVHSAIESYVRKNRIRYAIGFDQPVWQPGYAALRRGGVRRFVSYWGAPMSSVNRGWRLLAKRIEVGLRPSKPDHYIFESEGMRATGVNGRGIQRSKTSVCYLGVDTSRFVPNHDFGYVNAAFGIPHDRKIIVYAGHMEARKGVAVIVRAACELICHLGRKDVHFLFLGDRPGEADAFLGLYKDTAAFGHITFGGYRQDVEFIYPGCYAAVIASTGWDSFTLSALEFAACGLPVVVSDLPGLNEAVEPGRTGFTFRPGDHQRLAAILTTLLDSEGDRHTLARCARERVERSFSVERQRERLVQILNKAMLLSATPETPGGRP